MKTILVTGSAGFIGSNLVNFLLDTGYEVISIDNLSTGRISNLPSTRTSSHTFLNYDITNKEIVSDLSSYLSGKSIAACFHLAANADVRGGEVDSLIDFNQNILATHNICEVAKAYSIKHLLFSSTAACYGEPPASFIPTPETYHPLQTSHYGASKIAAEAIIEGYTSYGYFKSSVFRFVSWIGPRYSHGVIYDFVKKLLHSPTSLEILGNGDQKKSYLHVFDGIQAMYTAFLRQEQPHSIYNVGHDYMINVKDLASIIIKTMDLSNVEFSFTSDQPRGWIGDSPVVLLSTDTLKSLGCSPTLSIEDGIIDTTNYLLDSSSNLFR